jgi:formylglycine-generating enzyme required for sulfatase activity
VPVQALDPLTIAAISLGPTLDLPGERGRGGDDVEWEFACRGGAKVYSTFHYGNRLTSDLANFNGGNPYPPTAKKGTDLQRTTAVGSYKPNAFGLYDMHGNVWQWCLDSHGPYDRKAQKDPVAAGGHYRVLRGGAWVNDGRDCRAAARTWQNPGTRGHSFGFRVVCLLP